LKQGLVRALVLGAALAALGLAGYGAWRTGLFGSGAPAPSAAPDAAVLGDGGYAGSTSCQGCHTAEYQRWQRSQHAVAMQEATEQTVLGDFSGRSLRHGGVTSRLLRRDGRYVVTTDGADGKLADFEVRYTFGVHPLQQYLVELPGGRVQALPLAWDARPRAEGGQRWFHLYPHEQVGHLDELHWTRGQQNWNFMCADCHSTGVRKNYDAGPATFATTWREISVGCEACHGPARRHVELARAAAASGGRPSASGLAVEFDERRGVSWIPDPATGTATRSRPRKTSKELDVCAQCHARRGQFSDGYRPGAPFTDHYLPALLTEGLYHLDGQQRDEVFDWGSFLSGRMHAKGVTCGDCHDPHDGQIRAEGNAVCAQCHASTRYDTTSHHFHAMGTPGAACTACHMKTETYMVIDPRHDHSFRIPRPDRSVDLGAPNACNQCHTQRDASWAALEIRKRYPDPKPGYQGFAEAFAAADRQDPSASIALVQVVSNQEESAIARASALDRLAEVPGENRTLAAEAALDDASPLVRRAAVELYATVAPAERLAVAPLLRDPSRIVRMQAARTLAPVADEILGAEHAAARQAATVEYVAAERFNADRPEHRVNLGNYYAERGETDAAEAEYRAALALDRQFVPGWVNLSDLMRALGRETEAEATLRAGLGASPDAAALHHALGLSLVRQKRPSEALRELELATKLDPANERFRYVYGVAREELK
jgi:predicted CXXCH cytochrome family protein